MKNKLYLLLFVMLYSNVAIAASIAEQQQTQISDILTDMNQSAKEVADTVISNPQNAIDAGCLNNIMGIDLDVFAVDLTNIWSTIYGTIKSQIVDSACSASNDWVNQQTSVLDQSLEAPMGLGSISISQGSAIDEWQSVSTTDVELNNNEITTHVSTDVLGEVPMPSVINNAPSTVSNSDTSPAQNTNDLEDEMENMLDLGKLWGENP